MSKYKKFFVIMVLVAVNIFLAAGTLTADSHRKFCTYEEGAQGDCQEFCFTTCHTCHCGTDCEDKCDA